MRHPVTLALLHALLLSGISPALLAQDYPSKLMSQKLHDRLGQPVVVELI